MNVQATRTIELPAEVYEDLAAFASAHDLTVAEAVAGLLDGVVSPADADTLADISAGMAEADEGDFVPHEEVEAWLRSWGTPNELPPPRWK